MCTSTAGKYLIALKIHDGFVRCLQEQRDTNRWGREESGRDLGGLQWELDSLVFGITLHFQAFLSAGAPGPCCDGGAQWEGLRAQEELLSVRWNSKEGMGGLCRG